MSSAISACHVHRDWMGFDQATELALIVSLLNNTARFNHIITQVTPEELATHEDPQKVGHPFYYYLDEAKKVFGNWQGGTDGRYSVTGMSYHDLMEIFSKPQRLKNVVKILMDLICWVDTFVGKSTAEDIPIHVLALQFAKTIEAIKVAVELSGFEFGLFRIQIFLSVVSGVGLSKPGQHLHQLMIPTLNQASYKHLNDALQYETKQNEVVMLTNKTLTDISSTTPAVTMDPEYFETAMGYIADLLKVEPFHRNTIESILCEGRYGRICLLIMEVYVKGSSLHMLSECGMPLVKLYNTYTWVPVQMWKRKCVYSNYFDQ